MFHVVQQLMISESQRDTDSKNLLFFSSRADLIRFLSFRRTLVTFGPLNSFKP